MTQQDKIQRMVDDDIKKIRQDLENDDLSYLNDVLSGTGFVPYNQLTYTQIEAEYQEKFESKVTGSKI